ncbi:MAG TPA: hypothetical protein VFB50_12370 [Chloroflexota bacterium]|nr:hypothetical protein [Chloroflexota bacterium]
MDDRELRLLQRRLEEHAALAFDAAQPSVGFRPPVTDRQSMTVEQRWQQLRQAVLNARRED